MTQAANPRGGLNERSRRERMEQAVTAGASGVDTLISMLSDPSWALRRDVVAALATLGQHAIPALLHVLTARRDDETMNAAAVDALVASAGDPTAGLLELAAHPEPAVAADATQILGRRGTKEAIPVLARLASGENDNVAVAAIEALSRIGGRATVESLVSLVRSGNFFRTFPAIDVLGRSGDPRAVGPLAALLPDSRYCLEAMRALGRTAQRTAGAHLAEMLVARSPSTVRVAAMAIRQLSREYGERYGVEGAVDDVVSGAAPVGAAKSVAAALSGANAEEQEAIAHVLGMLNDPDARRALSRLVQGPSLAAGTAARCLARQGEGGRAELATIVRGGDSARRAAVLPLATAQGLNPSDVAHCLSDPDGKVRALACETLATLGARSSVPQLFELLEDPNPRVVQAAIGAIQVLRGADTERLTLAALASGSPRVASEAFRIVRAFGFPSALPAAIEAMGSDDERSSEAATLAVAAIDDPRAEATLIERLKSSSARQRGLVARALGQRDPSASVTEALLVATGDDDPWVRYYAARALARAGHGYGGRVLAKLKSMLGDVATQVRLAAVEALAHHASAEAVALLVEAADSPEEDVRRAAVMGLGIAKAQEALPTLIRAASSRDSSTRLVAIAALAGFEGPAVIERLAVAARDLDPNVRSTAVGALASRPGQDATLALAAVLLADPTNDRARLALSAPSAGRIAGLMQALETADDESAPTLVAAFVRMRTQDATNALVALTMGANVAARKAAVTALGVVEGPEASDALRAAETLDADAAVRRLAALALGAR